jgi:hypothetical protein
MRRLLFLVCALAIFSARPARAFCGFYVSDADQKLYNNATMVVLMREGDAPSSRCRTTTRAPPKSGSLDGLVGVESA